MKKVSIRTDQNVAIDFPIASVGQRMLGLGIDLMVMGVLVFFMFIVLVSLNPNFVYAAALVFLFYTPVSEMITGGQTIGKKMAGTRVVNIAGKAPSHFETLIRWAFRMVDIWFSLGALGIIFISTDARGRRLGGILSNTMVISLKADMDLQLNDILRIEDRSNYKPVYPAVYRFAEKDMLTVKNVADRYAGFRNSAHAALVTRTADKCAQVLELQEVPEDKLGFLKTLVRDYIVVTRS